MNILSNIVLALGVGFVTYKLTRYQIKQAEEKAYEIRDGC